MSHSMNTGFHQLSASFSYNNNASVHPCLFSNLDATVFLKIVPLLLGFSLKQIHYKHVALLVKM
jgi:hypothetical protein